jgi:kinesin family member 15
MIANVSPCSTSIGETLSTLKFAQRTKLIKNRAVINEDSSGTVSILKDEIKRLKLEIKNLKLGGYISETPQDNSNSEETSTEHTVFHFREAITLLR